LVLFWVFGFGLGFLALWGFTLGAGAQDFCVAVTLLPLGTWHYSALLAKFEQSWPSRCLTGNYLIGISSSR